MASTTYGLSLSALTRTAAAVRRTERLFGGSAPGSMEQADNPVRYAKLTSDLTGGKWAAIEVIGGVWDDMPQGITWSADNPLVVIGPPMKAGLIVPVQFAPMTGSIWLAHGYESRVLDWGDPNGTGNTGPFVYEGDAMKIKTWKTDDGLTWTQEKIDMTAGGLAGPC